MWRSGKGNREDKTADTGCIIRQLEVNTLEKRSGQDALTTPNEQGICVIYTPISITPWLTIAFGDINTPARLPWYTGKQSKPWQSGELM